MVLYPDYYNEFECIGSECKCTCCAGWGIKLDDATIAYYKSLPGEFGDFLRNNINESGFIQLSSNGKCPFLNDKGLCNIYIECGPEYMSETCQKFPRDYVYYGENQINILSLACEAVLRLIYYKDSAIKLCEDNSSECGQGIEGTYVRGLEQFMSCAMSLLQDENYSFGVAMASVVHAGLMMSEFVENKNNVDLQRNLAAISGCVEEIKAISEELGSEILFDSTYPYIYEYVDIFCGVVAEEDESNKLYKYIWPDYYFKLNKEKRKMYIRQLLLERKISKEQKRFIRRMAAAYYMILSSVVGQEELAETYMSKFANYMLLLWVLPVTWEVENTLEYLVKVSLLSRTFLHSDNIRKKSWEIFSEQVEVDETIYQLMLMTIGEC